MAEFPSFTISSLMMDRQCEKRRNLLKTLDSVKLFLDRERKEEYIETVYYLGENEAKETLWFDDYWFPEVETPYFDMGSILLDPICTHTCGYLRTLQYLKEYNENFNLLSNLRGFCNFNGKIQKVNQRNITVYKFLQGTNEPSVVMLKSFLLPDPFTGCDLNKNIELLGPEKRKKTVHRVSSFVMASTVFLWIVMDICSQFSIIQLQPKYGPIFFWSTFLKLFGFMAYVSATSAMIVVGAPFSGMQSFMLMFWAILMLLNSAKSLTELYLPFMGIILTGCYVLVLKYP